MLFDVILISFVIFIRTNGDVIKEIIYNFLSEKTYKHAVDLQNMKVKTSTAKTQPIFWKDV